MFIFFRDEINVIEFKQNSYSLTTKNKKAINEILNLLLKQNCIQKISLKISLITVLSTFVIWKNKKFKIVINLKKVNIKFYLNVYLLLR